MKFILDAFTYDLITKHEPKAFDGESVAFVFDNKGICPNNAFSVVRTIDKDLIENNKSAMFFVIASDDKQATEIDAMLRSNDSSGAVCYIPEKDDEDTKKNEVINFVEYIQTTLDLVTDMIESQRKHDVKTPARKRSRKSNKT